MGLRLVAPGTPLPGVERIIIYGRAGIGKSRLALSLSPRFGKILYYAADMNSEFLSSIDPRKRERIITIVPEGDNPTVNFTEFCMRDWTKYDPEIKTIVVDTYTKVALDVITYSANSGAVTAEKHFVIGDPNKGGQIIPNRGDYQAIESMSRGFLDLLFDKQRHMNIIFVMHEDVKMVENVHAVGGPAHPGRAMTEYLPGQFSTVIRVIRKPFLVPGESVPRDVVVAVTDNDGKFIAKTRTHDEKNPNPLGQVVLDRDPTTFWTTKYDPIYAPQAVHTN